MSRLLSSRVVVAVFACAAGGLWAFTAALWLDLLRESWSGSEFVELAILGVPALPALVPGLLLSGRRRAAANAIALVAAVPLIPLAASPLLWATLNVLARAPLGQTAWVLYSLPFLPLAAYASYRALSHDGRHRLQGEAGVAVLLATFGTGLLLRSGATMLAQVALLAPAPALGAGAGVAAVTAGWTVDAVVGRQRPGKRQGLG